MTAAGSRRDRSRQIGEPSREGAHRHHGCRIQGRVSGVACGGECLAGELREDFFGGARPGDWHLRCGRPPLFWLVRLTTSRGGVAFKHHCSESIERASPPRTGPSPVPEPAPDPTLHLRHTRAAPAPEQFRTRATQTEARSKPAGDRCPGVRDQNWDSGLGFWAGILALDSEMGSGLRRRTRVEVGTNRMIRSVPHDEAFLVRLVRLDRRQRRPAD